MPINAIPGLGTRVHPNAARELQTFWDGSIAISVAGADYDCLATLGKCVMVRGIEVGDTSGGNVVVLDHEDAIAASGAIGDLVNVLASQSFYFIAGGLKAPMPRITKIRQNGTTAAAIRLYYQVARA